MCSPALSHINPHPSPSLPKTVTPTTLQKENFTHALQQTTKKTPLTSHNKPPPQKPSDPHGTSMPHPTLPPYPHYNQHFAAKLLEPARLRLV
ncbi:hypothetical protein CC80DRAFT_493831, partial [Byssothecium circinans]